MSWYAIRHSVETYMTREEDLAAAQAQLRHKSEQTTMKYDQTPVEDRKDALNRMDNCLNKDENLIKISSK